MVYLKGLFFATSLLLSGVAATPFPADKRSAAAPDVQAVKGFSVESRGLHDVFAADIKDASKDKRVVVPPVHAPVAPAVHPEVPPPRLGGDEPAPGGARPDAEGPLPGAKPADTAPPVRLNGEKETPSGPTCRKPNLRRDTILRRGPLVPAQDPFNIYESEYATANKFQKGDRPAVVDLSGCTSLFFYDKDNKPSIFHITAGEESVRAAEAAAMVNEVHGDARGVRIKAADKAHFDAAAEGIKSVNPNINIRNTATDGYNARVSDNGSGKRTRLTAEAGNQNIVGDVYQC